MEYTTIKIPKGIAVKLRKYRESNDLCFRNNTELVLYIIREFLKENGDNKDE
ncbi:MAG: hypothetical protein ACTSRP_09100 [Candidatus Helarchaeota archaeon]